MAHRSPGNGQTSIPDKLTKKNEDDKLPAISAALVV